MRYRNLQYRFQKDFTEREGEYAQWFHTLCQPLQRAWSYGYLRRHAPDLYKRDIDELLTLWNMIHQKQTQLILPSTQGMIAIELFAIVSEDPDNMIVLDLGGEELGWTVYIETLKSLILEDPDSRHYLQLIADLDLPFTVTIVQDDDTSRYDIRGI